MTLEEISNELYNIARQSPIKKNNSTRTRNSKVDKLISLRWDCRDRAERTRLSKEISREIRKEMRQWKRIKLLND